MPTNDLSFLPANAPAEGVVDCGGILSAQQLSRLNAQAQQAHFKIKVVILPPKISPPSIKLLTYEIAQQWHMPSDGLLMVINVGGHNLRLVAGPKLKREGITDQKITELIRTRFGPSMRHAHSVADITAGLPDGISNTIEGVNQALPQSAVTATAALNKTIATQKLPVTPGALAEPTYLAQTGTTSGFNIFVPIAIIAAIILSIFYIQRREQEKKTPHS